ncbi:MAG TPA: tetratricopeptide repeat protein [Verrucomicrobia bacterium]|nr:tetratricopeptide repeat protein [Verrucomicrobiota bacterium]HOP97471.1 tetratricopeptide repeat protein [Verrucomicrobiota bacterium]
MEPLDHSERLNLDAAEGWLGLGNEQEARAELAKIPADKQEHPEVLDVWWRVHARSRDWSACERIGSRLIAVLPDSAHGWIQRSYALHEMRRTQEAFDLLRPAWEKFQDIWTIAYNLACYCAQLERLEEARIWLGRAMRVDENAVRRAAADDPDLKPLWEHLGGMPWEAEE